MSNPDDLEPVRIREGGVIGGEIRCASERD